MGDRPIISFLLELAATGLMVYTSANPDTNLAAIMWLAMWKAAQTLARGAGRIAMKAELRYFEVVKL